MNINTLLADIAQQIALDAELDAWCMDTYGRNCKVLVNYDTRNPPGESDCPFVAIYPGAKRAGQAVAVKEHVIDIGCCIHDEASVVHPETNMTEYKGVQRIEVMRKYVEDAVAGTSMGNALVAAVDIEYDTIDMFPFMVAAMAVTITEDVTIGSDALL